MFKLIILIWWVHFYRDMCVWRHSAVSCPIHLCVIKIDIFPEFCGEKSNQNLSSDRYIMTQCCCTRCYLCLKQIELFSELCGEKIVFLFFSFSHGPNKFTLYQNLLPTGRSFQPYITCPALLQFIFSHKKPPKTVGRGWLNLNSKLYHSTKSRHIPYPAMIQSKQGGVVSQYPTIQLTMGPLFSYRHFQTITFFCHNIMLTTEGVSTVEGSFTIVFTK